jgi:cell surface protein SprA
MFSGLSNQAFAQGSVVNSSVASSDSSLVYPFEDEGEFQYPDEIAKDPLYLNRPGNIERTIEYDPVSKQYVIYEKIGDMYYRLPKSMDLKDYVKYDFDKSINDYWRTRKDVEGIATEQRSLIPQLKIESEAFTNIFGSDVIDIKPQGYVEVQFGVKSNYNGNEQLSERQKRTTSFDFEPQINLSVTGKIGDKVDMKVNYNTEATFDFENQVKLEYNGKEDEILRKIEAGNVSLPLNGTLIQGGTNLMGIKTEMQFGKLNITTIVSQNDGESQVIETEGGAQKTEFELQASSYDENRHFFLSKFFREHYNEALSSLPLIRSKVIINKVEVWVTNKSQNFTSARDIVAFVDLGEQAGNIYNKIAEFQAGGGLGYPANYVPHNGANNMYQELTTTYAGVKTSAEVVKTLKPLASRGFTNGTDWEKIDQARLLNASEYTLNKQLGFISLNSPLNNDEVLAVAYNITIGDSTFQVGQFASDITTSSQTLVLKMLKGTNLSPDMPTWDLMMKNVYNIGGYDISADDFDFNVVYKNDSTSTYINYLPIDGGNKKTLLRLLNLDNLNSQGDYAQNGDGMFDFVEGLTILASSGKIIFPVLEPFGSTMAKFAGKDSTTYMFSSLYSNTKTYAETEDTKHNKFYLVGSYKGSSSSEISLNSFNLSQGSVKVSAGSTVLTENVDYTVDYALGKVKIINQAYIESGTPIKVSTESQDVLSMQRKTMIGSYATYKFSDKFSLGGTALWMNERPITSKVDLGEEPVSNLMLGLDFQYNQQSQLLTDLINYLPFIDSDTKSSLSVEGEVAKLITGSSKTTGNNVYIDDFEGVETSYSMTSAMGWYLASTPQWQPDLIKDSDKDDLSSGYYRSKLAWYYIDRIFSEKSSTYMPSHIKADLAMLSNHYMRDVLVQEIFPGKELTIGSNNYQSILNLAYYPKEKGPYNFDLNVDFDGKLRNPEDRWGGIMREVQTPNFETANIEYIEFWLLDPFIYNKDGSQEGGDLYFNLGNVSEDILSDSRKSFENGLPSTSEVENVDTTVWGRVSTNQLLNNSFENDADSRKYQDVGFDGLSSDEEQTFFKDYLEEIKNKISAEAYNKVVADPSGDDYHYYRGGDYDDEEVSIIDRYKKYNNFEGNSPTTSMYTESYSTSGKSEPDIEDINDDNTLNEIEKYFQYKVSIRPGDLNIGQNYVVDKVQRQVALKNGTTDVVNWYQFKIPIRNNSNAEAINGISDFKSIRFMRMFLTNFSDSVILRFGTLNLVRSDWRKENQSLADVGAVESANAALEMATINIEENQNRKPINYVLPPDIEREFDPTSTTATLMNEQSMLLKVVDLEKGDAKAVYKNVGLDMRMYKKLKMEVHAEAVEGYPLSDYETSLFVRMGSDNDNYYEYEIPLMLTPVPATTYNADSESDRLVVWPDENRLNVSLSIFTDLKLKRDEAVRKAGSTISKSDIFQDVDANSKGDKNIIRIKGNPSLGDVEIMHVGIRNLNAENKIAKTVEVWVNELRLSGYEADGGWASNGRMSLRLADLGNVTLAGSTQSVGWGSINQSASQRSLENTYQVDLTANFQLGKLLPEKVGLHLPLFYSYSKGVATPEYDPLNSDVKLSESLALIDSPEEKDYLKSISQDVTTRKSLNFNNVTIEPQRKKADRTPLPTDIENFSVSYSRSEELNHNVDVEKQLERNTKASFDYNYTITSKPITPFKNVKFLNNKAFKIIKDFNFNLLPELISYRTDIDKSYSERLARDNSGMELDLPITVSKDFLWNRNFDLRYSLSQNLKVDFTNKSTARIDQLDGVEDELLYPDEYALMQKKIYKNLLAFGRPVDYQHTLNVRYTIPINKLPLLDFVNSSLTYRGGYDWIAGSLLSSEFESVDLGNTVNNTMNLNLNGSLNMTTLYNKVPYFKEINQKYQSTGRNYGSRSKTATKKKEPAKSDKPARTKEVKYQAKKVDLKANVPKSIFHKLETEDVKVVLLTAKGDTIKGDVTVVNENRVNFKAEKSYKGAQVFVVGKREISESIAKQIVDYSTRFLLGVRNVQATYSKSGGTELPGFLPDPYLFGARNVTSTDGSSSLAPTLPFLMGWQDESFALKAANRGWVSQDTTISKQYLVQSTETWNFSVQLEPISNLRFNVTGRRRESSNVSSYIQFNGAKNSFELLSRKETGNFDMSILTLKTAFRQSLSDDEKKSDLFDEFNGKNRQIILERINKARGYVEGQGYSKSPYADITNGVSATSSDVIIPAFIATYTGIDANKIPLTARPGLAWIRPNWTVNYNGNPEQIEWLKNYVNTLNFNHSYRSTYTIGSFETNLDYDADESGFSWVRSQLNDDKYFVPELDITSINIQEDLSPLINIDVGFVNDLSANFEIRKTRNLNFSFSNMQLSEMIKNEYSVGVGYRFSGMDMILKTKRNTETVSNDVNLRLDVASSNYKTTFRTIDKEEGILQNGTRIFSIDFQADYMVSDKLTVKLYYQYNMNAPHSTEDGYTQKNTKFGLTFNYSIM